MESRLRSRLHITHILLLQMSGFIVIPILVITSVIT
jgi:hypothetical protein